MKRVLKAFAFAAAIVVALVSCKKEEQQKDVALTGIELNATTQALQVGQEFQLTVTYKPENATTKPAASWESDAPAVATVADGKVTAVAAGSANITAKVGSFTATCAVTVTSAEEEVVPVEGNSEWSIIGALLGTNWDKDFVAAKDGDIYVVKNVKLAASDAFKFRKNKDWGENRGAEGDVEPYKLAAGTAITVVHNGKNLAAPGDGIYDIYYNAAVEQLCLVAKDGTPTWNEVVVPPTDFTSPNWANIPGITNGNHTFKFTKDDKNAYFYTERSNEGRYSELWGAGKGYIYFAFDFDGDLTTGEELNGNGKYEYIAFIYCFGGTADAPVIEITADGGVAPSSYTVANVIAKGTADANGAKVEYCVPLADLPELPEEFTIYTWGNKDLAKVVYPYPYEAPAVATWTEAEAAGAIHFFQYLAPGWSPIEGYANVEADSFENLTVADGVYTLNYTVAAPERWQSQFYMRPNPAKATLPLKAGQNYLVSLTFKANQTFSAFAKICQYNPELTANGEPKHEGATIHEWGETLLTADKEKTIAYVIEGVDCDNINFTLDFGTHPENTVVEISKVKVEPSDLPAGPVEDGPSDPVAEWDYTPSEQYLASTNLWKAVDDAKAVGYFYHYPAAGFTTVTANSYELITLKQSTYVLSCPQAATDGLWSNQLFMYPQEGHFIALDPAKTYKLKVTLGSNKDFSGFFKMSRYNPDASNHEGGAIWETNYPVGFIFEGGNPVVLENEFTGVEAVNPILIFAFGGNPADCEVYIKDIILEEAKAPVPTVTEFVALEKGTEGTLEGIVAAKGNNGIIVTDGTTNLYAFKPTGDCNVGDKVNIAGKKDVYYGLAQVAQGGVVTVVSSGNTVPATAVVDINATFDAYPDNASVSDIVTFKGALTISGSNTNVAVAGAEKRTGSLEGMDFSAYAGKDVTVTGYYIGTAGSGGKYLKVIATSIEEVGAAPVNITIDGDMSDWADVPSADPADLFNAFKVWNDADNFYFYVDTTPGSRLWEGGAYLYLYFDLDNDPSTGDDGSTGAKGKKYESWVYLFCFGDSSNYAVAIQKDGGTHGMSAEGIEIKGTGSADTCVLELSIPRANFTTAAPSVGDVINVMAYRSKDGGNVNFPGYVVK
jgi:hypothetical protein